MKYARHMIRATVIGMAVLCTLEEDVLGMPMATCWTTDSGTAGTNPGGAGWTAIENNQFSVSLPPGGKVWIGIKNDDDTGRHKFVGVDFQYDSNEDFSAMSDTFEAMSPDNEPSACELLSFRFSSNLVAHSRAPRSPKRLGVQHLRRRRQRGDRRRGATRGKPPPWRPSRKPNPPRAKLATRETVTMVRSPWRH